MVKVAELAVLVLAGGWVISVVGLALLGRGLARKDREIMTEALNQRLSHEVEADNEASDLLSDSQNAGELT